MSLLCPDALALIEQRGALGAYRRITARNTGRPYMTFEDLATGASGDTELEKRLLRVYGEAFAIFCDRQRKYGSRNIAAFGLDGVVVRASDKVARLANLTFQHRGDDAADESVADTLLDLCNYGAIGMLCHKDEWPR